MSVLQRIGMERNLLGRVTRRCRHAIPAARRAARAEAQVMAFVRELDATLSAVGPAQVESRVVRSGMSGLFGPRTSRIVWSSRSRGRRPVRSCELRVEFDRYHLHVGGLPFAYHQRDAALERLTRLVVSTLFAGPADPIAIGTMQRPAEASFASALASCEANPATNPAWRAAVADATLPKCQESGQPWQRRFIPTA